MEQLFALIKSAFLRIHQYILKTTPLLLKDIFVQRCDSSLTLSRRNVYFSWGVTDYIPDKNQALILGTVLLTALIFTVYSPEGLKHLFPKNNFVLLSK